MKHLLTYSFNHHHLYLIEENGYLTDVFFSKPSEDINEELSPTLELAKSYLDAYFKGQEPDVDVPLKVGATPFQKEVYEVLQEVKFGETITYQELANRIASKRGIKKMSSQAIGQALKKNPLPIFIPCHRVIGTHNLGGYNGGLELKKFLLDLEKKHTIF